MNVGFIDFETQCADAKNTRFTEVGFSIWKHDGNPFLRTFPEWQKIRGNSLLAYEPEYPPQSEMIIELTGITDKMLKKDGLPRATVIKEHIIPFMNECDIILAHKTAFDKTVLVSTAKLFGIDLPEKEWFCTLTELPWPKKFTCHKLSHLAYDHSILVDPATLHRAEQDVDLLAQIVSKYKFDDLLAYKREPWIYLHADTVGPWQDGGTQTTFAKTLGFSWEYVKGTDFPHFPKRWITRVKARDVERIKEAVASFKSPFRVSVIEGIN